MSAFFQRLVELARSARATVATQVPRTAHPATGYLLLFMVIAGIVLRIQNVGYPFHFGFDEPQYVGAAQQFLIGVPDTGECCHPPLSKLLIGVGMLLFGNNPLGWRFAPLCFGIQNIVLVFLIATSLFNDRKAGWFAAAFMAADGYCLTYSRAALPDIILASLVLWSILAAIEARSWLGVLVCAILVGLAASIKWVGLLVGLPVCFTLLVLGRVRWHTLTAFLVVPFVHYVVWMVGLNLIGHASDPMAVWAEMRNRQRLHLGFPHHTNPLESPWYSWLVMYHPIVIKSAFVGTKVRLASSVGNPVLWLAADLSLVALPAVGAAWALKGRLAERWGGWFDSNSNRALAILGVSWLSMMLLWISGRIVTYWYHYLTPWSFALTLVAGIVSCLDRRFPRGVLAFVSVVLLVSIYFSPVWAEIPITASAAHHRLPFASWW